MPKFKYLINRFKVCKAQALGLLSTDPYIIRIRVYTLVYTLYMANWAVVYAFSDSTRKAYMAAIWAQNRGFRVPFEGTNTSLRSGFTQVDASHNSPVGCNCNCNACCASSQDCEDVA